MRDATIVVFVWLSSIASVELQTSRIWTIQIGSQAFGAMHYRDRNGSLRGIAIDAIDAVCQEGGMDCRIVTTDHDLCWQSSVDSYHSGGRGLFGHWFDGCFAFVATVERMQVFTFARPMYAVAGAFLWVIKGGSLDPHNLQGKKIGFLYIWASSESCLARNSRDFVHTSKSAIRFWNTTAALNALKNQEVDGVFSYERAWTPAQLMEIEKVHEIKCHIGGRSMMSRKDSAFIANWNVGLMKLINSNKLLKLCAEINERHKHQGAPHTCLI